MYLVDTSSYFSLEFSTLFDALGYHGLQTDLQVPVVRSSQASHEALSTLSIRRPQATIPAHRSSKYVPKSRSAV
jgi:hypothetical protein